MSLPSRILNHYDANNVTHLRSNHYRLFTTKRYRFHFCRCIETTSTSSRRTPPVGTCTPPHEGWVSDEEKLYFVICSSSRFRSFSSFCSLPHIDRTTQMYGYSLFSRAFCKQMRLEELHDPETPPTFNAMMNALPWSLYCRKNLFKPADDLTISSASLRHTSWILYDLKNSNFTFL